MFAYTAKDSMGNTVSGEIDAVDIKAASSELRSKGYFILDIKPIVEKDKAKPGIFGGFVEFVIYPIFAGVSIGQLAVFYRELATMIKAGMSVLQSLQSLNNRMFGGMLKKATESAIMHIRNGGMMSEAFSEYPWIFQPMHIQLIRAGEIGGKLEMMLDRLAEYVESEQRSRQKMRMAALYPILLILAAIFIPPVPKLVLGNASAYFDQTIGLIGPVLLIILVLLMIHKMLLQWQPYRFIFGGIVLWIPLIGGMIRMFALSKFYRSFAALYAAGISPTDCLSYAAETTGNGYITAVIKRGVPKMAEGQSMADVFESIGIFPSMTIDMMNTGVQTGDVDKMMNKAAEYTESQGEFAMHRFLTIAPVLLFLAIAVYIGYIVVNSYVNMYTNILTPQQ